MAAASVTACPLSELLPARLGHARQLAHQGSLPEADAAHGEAAHVAPRSPAHLAAVVRLNREARCALRLGDHRLLCHVVLLVALERHAEELEEHAPLLIGLRRGDDADLEPAEAVDAVVVDLGIHELLAQSQAVVAAAVEAAGRNSAEVADSR